MTPCSVCHQNELGEEALALKEAILARGQMVCASCAEQFGIPADPPVLLVQQARGTTEEMPVPVKPAASPAGPLVAITLACLAAGASGWALWMQQDLTNRVADYRREAPPTVVRPPSEDLKILDRKLAETEKALSELRTREADSGREMARLVADLREETRKAREQSTAAREAAENASRDLAAAVAKALAEKTAAMENPGKTESPERPKTPSGSDVLAEHYWDLAQNRAKALAQRGRLSQAIKEFEAIPFRHRIPGYDQRVADFRVQCDRQALERADLVLKSLDARLAAAEYFEAEQLLVQVLEECAFEPVQKKLEPKLEEVRALLRAQSQREQEDSLKSKHLLVAGLLDDLAKPDEKTRQRTVEALRTLGPEAIGPLTRALERPEPAVRWGILMALGGIRSPEAVPAILKRLKDSDRKVRLMAADVLSEFDDTRAVPELIEALADADSAVSEQAETTLERITHHMLPPEAGEKPAERASAWRAWWESGRLRGSKP